MTVPARLLLYIGAGLVLLALVLWGPAACNRLMTEKAAHRIDQGQNKATLDSLDTANQTEAEQEALADSIEAENKVLADSIRAAEPGDSNAATMRAVCRTRTYRNHPDCQENGSAP